MIRDSIYLFSPQSKPPERRQASSHCFTGPSWPLSKISPDYLWHKGQFFDTCVYIVGLTLFPQPTKLRTLFSAQSSKESLNLSPLEILTVQCI